MAGLSSEGKQVMDDLPLEEALRFLAGKACENDRNATAKILLRAAALIRHLEATIEGLEAAIAMATYRPGPNERMDTAP